MGFPDLGCVDVGPWTVMEHPMVSIVFPVFVYRVDLPARPDLIIIIAPAQLPGKGKSEHRRRPGVG